METELEIKSTEVLKELELEYDLGNMLATDKNNLSIKECREDKENFLSSLARDNTQLLINKLFGLEHTSIEGTVVVTLPAPSTRLPREKKIPKPKPPTKWENYAKEKGIQKRKKTKLVWDEMIKDWVPRYGYKRVQAEHAKDWMLEVPDNADPYEDQFAKKKNIKQENIAKNELQRLKNIARANKVKVPAMGLTSMEQPSTKQMEKAISVAHKATASAGVFQKKLPKEKPGKASGKKRKFEPVFRDSNTEQKRNKEILDNLFSKKSKLDVEKAVGRSINEEQTKRATEKRNKKKPNKGGKKRTHFMQSKKKARANKRKKT